METSTASQTTTASAPAAPAETAAPAVATEPAPQAASAATPSQEKPPSSGLGAPTVEDSPVDASGDDGDGEAFDIESWDGEIDSLPPDYVPLVKAFSTKLESKFSSQVKDAEARAAALEEREAKMAELEQRSALLDALLDGNEDPRIAQTAAMLEQHKADLEKARAEAAEAKAQLEQFHAEVEKVETERVSAMWEDWKSRNPSLVKNEADVEAVVKLLDSGWDLDTIPKLAALPKALAKQARDLVAKGEASPRVALQLFSSRPQQEERPASALVSGAHGPNGTPAEMKQGKYAANYQDLKDSAISRALRKIS